MILSQFARRDGRDVVAVLLPSASVESPRLNAATRVGRKMHVAAGGRHAQLVDPRERSRIAHEPAVVPLVAKTRLRASPSVNPTFGHTPTIRRKKQSEGKFGPTAIPNRTSDIGLLNMAYGCLTLEVADRIATMTVNRPDKLNALNDATVGELGKAIEEVRANDAVAGIILTGAGRAFVAGADISELRAKSPGDAYTLAR